MDNPKYTREELEDFVKAILRASDSIREYDPDAQIVTLNGGLLLYDVMYVASPREIDTETAVYFPGSSRIKDSRRILRNCFINFLLERQHDDIEGPRRIASLDEVVGGHSVCRVLNSYDYAIREVAKYNIGKDRNKIDEEARRLREMFPFKIFGISDYSKSRRRGREYNLRKRKGQIVEFPTKRIITMDDPDFETVRFSHSNTTGWRGIGYLPKIESIILSRKYMDFLHDVARMVGKNPADVDVPRARVRSDCEFYSRKPRFE